MTGAYIDHDPGAALPRLGYLDRGESRTVRVTVDPYDPRDTHTATSGRQPLTGTLTLAEEDGWVQCTWTEDRPARP